jgi:Tfp pilus assembly protein PilN
MRPVNLIPKEERRGQNAPLRSGPIAYIVVGALVAMLGAVTLLVLTNNEIADRKTEIATLEREDAKVTAKVKRLSAYTQFHTLSEQRVDTVKSLADTRFDWERVMRELSLVLPSDVWLTSLNASASASSATGESESSGSGMRAAIAGPALELSGCANGQRGVAGFVTALKDIDGVTRVGVQSSELAPTGTAAGTGEGGATGGSASDCRTRGFIAQFTMVVAFDAAPVAAVAAEGEELATVAAEPSEAAPAEETSTSSPEG